MVELRCACHVIQSFRDKRKSVLNTCLIPDSCQILFKNVRIVKFFILSLCSNQICFFWQVIPSCSILRFWFCHRFVVVCHHFECKWCAFQHLCQAHSVRSISIWSMNLGISTARKFLNQGGFPASKHMDKYIYIYISIHKIWMTPFCDCAMNPATLIFQAYMGLCRSFFCPPAILHLVHFGFSLQWRGAKTDSKECWSACH